MVSWASLGVADGDDLALLDASGEVTFADLRAKATESRLAASTFVSLPGRPACRIEAMTARSGQEGRQR